MFTYNVGYANSPKVVGPYKIVTLPMISSGVGDEEKASQSHGMCTWHHNTYAILLSVLNLTRVYLGGLPLNYPMTRQGEEKRRGKYCVHMCYIFSQ